MKKILNNQCNKPIATRVVIEFSYFILTLNNFLFKEILSNRGLGTCVLKRFHGEVLLSTYRRYVFGH